MMVVLDASAAMEIVLEKDMSEAFREVLKQADLVVAPDTYPSEITNVFWKYGCHGNFPMEKCGEGIDYCINLVDDYISTRAMCREALAEALQHRHPAYDLFYLILARRNNALLLTKDKKLIQIAKELNVTVPANG